MLQTEMSATEHSKGGGEMTDLFQQVLDPVCSTSLDVGS